MKMPSKIQLNKKTCFFHAHNIHLYRVSSSRHHDTDFFLAFFTHSYYCKSGLRCRFICVCCVVAGSRLLIIFFRLVYASLNMSHFFTFNQKYTDMSPSKRFFSILFCDCVHYFIRIVLEKKRKIDIKIVTLMWWRELCTSFAPLNIYDNEFETRDTLS